MTRAPRSPPRPPRPGALTTAPEITGGSTRALTLPDRSVALPDNVRELLDWLIDEELKRWLREER